jgi:N-acetylneuraminic acid mutarotase
MSDFAWQPKSAMNQARSDSRSAALNGRVYIVGGYVHGYDRTAAVEEYDPATDVCVPKAPISEPVSGPAIAAYNGKIYRFGGFRSTGDPSSYVVVTTSEAYDINADAWTPRAALPQATVHAAVGVVAGKIYVIAGSYYDRATNTEVPINNVQIYDPATDTWSAGKPMPVAGDAINGYGVVGGKVYVFGNPTYAYDPATDSWSSPLSPAPPIAAPASAVIGDRIYLFGGKSPAGQIVADVWEYDASSDSWARKSPMPTAVWHWPAASVVSNITYVLGGIRWEFEQSSTIVQQGVRYGCVLDLTFDGDARDHSGLAHETTVIGNVTFEPGVIGQAARFNGTVCSGDHVAFVKVASSEALKLNDQATLMAWVQIDTNLDYSSFHCQRDQGGYPEIVSKGARYMSRWADYGLFIGSDISVPQIPGHFGWESSSPPIGGVQWVTATEETAKGQWHHLAATFNHGFVTL